MKTIFKFPLVVCDEITLNMPIGAEILTVQLQERVPCIWARVDPTRCSETRVFRIHGTGNPIPSWDKEIYIGTWQQEMFVWHLFEFIK